MVIIHSNQRAGFAQCNPYTMDVDRGNWNYYSYREFRHLVRNCRNREIENRIREGKRLEYGQNNRQSNLNRKEDLIVLD